MASSIISFNNGSALGGKLVRAMSSATIFMNDVNDLLRTINSATSNGTEPANIESNGVNGDIFGVAAGQGAALVAAITALSTALNAGNKAQIASLYRG